MYAEKVLLPNLVLDIDGVVEYKELSLTQKANKAVINYVSQALDQGQHPVVHINTLRGISFRTIGLPGLLTSTFGDDVDIYFSGCAGSFTIDLQKCGMVFDSKGLSLNALEAIVENPEIRHLLKHTGQNDCNYWAEHVSGLPSNILDLIAMEHRLYWDPGYPLSSSIYKCAIDLPLDYEYLHILTRSLETIEGISYWITGTVLEILNEGVNKGMPVQQLISDGKYSNGPILIVGDNPEGVDGPMLRLEDGGITREAFEYPILAHGNNLYGINEPDLLKGFLEILENAFVSREA